MTRYNAIICFVLITVYAFSISSAGAAIILNCQSQHKIEIAKCGITSICVDKFGKKIMNPYLSQREEDENSGWSYRLFADNTKLLFIREDGREYEWVNVPNQYGPENNQFKISTNGVSGSYSAFGNSRVLNVHLKEKKFFFITTRTHARIEVGTCQ